MSLGTASDPLPSEAIDTAQGHIADMLALAIEHKPPARALLVADANSVLARALTEAYRRCLPDAVVLPFDESGPTEVLAAFERLAPRDLVVLIQSTSFRLNAFRIRLGLFARKLAVSSTRTSSACRVRRPCVTSRPWPTTASTSPGSSAGQRAITLTSS